jgi:hypothetical protein
MGLGLSVIVAVAVGVSVGARITVKGVIGVALGSGPPYCRLGFVEVNPTTDIPMVPEAAGERIYPRVVLTPEKVNPLKVTPFE